MAATVTASLTDTVTAASTAAVTATATREIVIVGAGPAGLAAATRAAQAGADVLLIDENPSPGGQIYRQPPGEFRAVVAQGRGAPPSADPSARRGAALLAAFEAARAGVEVWQDTAVLGVFPERRLTVLREGRVAEVRAERLILAAGALERVAPFPGWTLPGVMTAGGCQIMVKSQRVLPGRRVVVAGTGPLLLVVACQLLRAGSEVAAVVEAGSLAPLWLAPWPALRNLALVGEGLGYLRELRRAGVPFLQRHAIAEAMGDEGLEAVRLTRLDGQWRPRAGREVTLQVDAAAVGFGFVSNTELSRMAGCDHAFDPLAGGWRPVLEAGMETTVPGIHAAGDGAGVAGAVAAAHEGRLAALGALQGLGRLSPKGFRREARTPLRELRRMADFRAVLDAVSAPRPGLWALCQPETILCRCEGVTRAEVERAITEGASTLDGLKRRTRAGMGFCQGRVCMPSVAALAGLAAGRDEAAFGWHRPRPPLRPVPLESFALDDSA